MAVGVAAVTEVGKCAGEGGSGENASDTRSNRSLFSESLKAD